MQRVLQTPRSCIHRSAALLGVRTLQTCVRPTDLLYHPPPPYVPENSSMSRAVLKHEGDPKEKGRSPNENEEAEKIGDKEWELRVGRAIYVLRATIPRFFESGLVSSATTAGDHNGVELEPTVTDEIYSKSIRLTYTPPVRLPAPFPQTLQVEGLSLYHASAVLFRTSFAAMHSDCTLNMVSVNAISLGHRERKLKIGLTIEGNGRVTGTKAVWDVITTYTFSPISGLVLQHDIDSINPAPLFDSMRSSVLRLMGLAAPAPPPAKTCTATATVVNRSSKKQGG